jgi:hypothetical protein
MPIQSNLFLSRVMWPNNESTSFLRSNIVILL